MKRQSYFQEYYRANKIRINIWHRQYYKRKRLLILKNKKNHYRKNSLKIKSIQAIYRKKTLERKTFRNRQYYIKNSIKIKRAVRLYQKINSKSINIKKSISGQTRAKYMVKKSIKAGILPNLKIINILCIDCKKARATNWEHRDYNKPFLVDSVCQSCNLKRGPAIPIKIVKK